MTVSTGLDTAYPLDPAATARFDEQGFIKLPGVLHPETIARYEPEITSKVIELNVQHLPLADRDTYGKAFLQVVNLWEHSELVREFVFSRRLARIAAEPGVAATEHRFVSDRPAWTTRQTADESV